MSGGNGGRRFWRDAAAVTDGNGFAVTLDGRVLRLPSGAALRLDTRALAEAVATEWAGAGGGATGAGFAAAELPLTRLAAARQERVAPDRERVVEHLLGFLDGDVLRYRDGPGTALRGKQDRAWEPWLARWAERHGGALSVVAGVMPADTGPAARAAAGVALRELDDAGLAALLVLVPALNSLVLGMAVADGSLDARSALELSLLDAHDQQARWGTVAESEEREAALDRDVAAAARFLRLSGKERDDG